MLIKHKNSLEAQSYEAPIWTTYNGINGFLVLDVSLIFWFFYESDGEVLQAENEDWIIINN